MIRHGPTETVRRSLLRLDDENAIGVERDRGRVMTRVRILTALRALDADTSALDGRGTPPRVLACGDATMRWSSPATTVDSSMTLDVSLEDLGSVRVGTGDLPPDSPLRRTPADAAELVRMHRATLSAALAALDRIIAGGFSRPGDPVVDGILADAACVAGGASSPGEPSRAILVARSPFAGPTVVVHRPRPEDDDAAADAIDATTPPAVGVSLVHSARGASVDFRRITARWESDDAMSAMRAHARHAARSGEPWWR